jgi:hypothetical protein
METDQKAYSLKGTNYYKFMQELARIWARFAAMPELF